MTFFLEKNPILTLLKESIFINDTHEIIKVKKRQDKQLKLLQSAHTVLLSAQLFISHPEKAKSKDLQTTDIKMLQMFCKHWPLLIVATNFTYKQCLPSLLGKSDCLQHTCSSGMDFCYGFIFQGFGDQKPQKCSHSMDIRYLTCFRLISVHHSAKQHR